MTDNEIIKALEICADYENCVSIDKVLTYRGIPLRYLFENTLDLINRQKEENERLQSRIKELEQRGTLFAKGFYKKGIKDFVERWHKKLNEAKKLMIPNAIAESSLDIAIAITAGLAKELTEHKETVSMIDGHIEE